MNRLRIYILSSILFPILLTACCIPYSYISKVPPLNSFPNDYFNKDEKILVLSFWLKLPSLAHTGYEPVGKYYFAKPLMVNLTELNEIHKQIQSKASFGLITLSTTTGSGTYI